MEQDRPVFNTLAAIRFVTATAAAADDSLLLLLLLVLESSLPLPLLLLLLLFEEEEECATEISSTMRANPKSQIYFLGNSHIQ